MNIFEEINDIGVEIIFRHLGDGLRGSTFQKNNKWYIIVNKNDPPERQNFTIAHEFFEIKLDERNDLSIDEKHNLANQKASELLLPSCTFAKDVNEFNLDSLKEKYPFVSYEVLTRRYVYFKNCVITIFDNKSIYIRFGSPNMNFPYAPITDEIVVMEKLYEKDNNIKVEGNGLTIEGYVLEEKNYIRRVILITYNEDNNIF